MAKQHDKQFKLDAVRYYEEHKELKGKAKTNEDVVGVKAIFIRILWNMGILIFINHVEWDGNKLENLTLVKGHKLKLLFGIDFKEIKNASTMIPPLLTNPNFPRADCD